MTGLGHLQKFRQTIPSQTPVLSKNGQKPIIALFSLMKESFDIFTSDFYVQKNYLAGSFPDVFLLMLICAPRKAGRRKRERLFPLFFLAPSLGPLRLVTSHSRFALAFVRNKSAKIESLPQLSQNFNSALIKKKLELAMLAMTSPSYLF